MEAWWSTKKPSDKKWFVQPLIIDRLKKKVQIVNLQNLVIFLY